MKRLPLFILCVIPLVGCSAGQTSNSEDSLVDQERNFYLDENKIHLIIDKSFKRTRYCILM